MAELSESLYQSLRDLNIDPHKKTLSEQDVNLIDSSDKAFIALTAYLNNLENICAAVNIGSVDYDCAYAVHSSGVVISYVKFRSFIEYYRVRQEDNDVYVELEKIARKWDRKDKPFIDEKISNPWQIDDNSGVAQKV